MADPTQPTLLAGGTLVAAADLTGDHIPDLVVENPQSDTLGVMLGIGAGAFGPPSSMLGLSWKLHHRVQPKPQSPRHRTGAIIGHCIGSVLSSTVIAWLIPLVVGMAAGSISALLLASVLGLRR